jgi:hypothetical protein
MRRLIGLLILMLLLNPAYGETISKSLEEVKRILNLYPDVIFAILISLILASVSVEALSRTIGRDSARKIAILLALVTFAISMMHISKEVARGYLNILLIVFAFFILLSIFRSFKRGKPSLTAIGFLLVGVGFFGIYMREFIRNGALWNLMFPLFNSMFWIGILLLFIALVRWIAAKRAPVEEAEVAVVKTRK